MHNKLDNIKLDVADQYHKVIATRKNRFTRSFFPKLDLLLNAVVYKSGISREFVCSYLFSRWFREFKEFWIEILDGRPIDIIDFHYLRQVYRMKFQSLAHTDESDADKFSEAWCHDSSIYLLFSAVWRYAKSAHMDFVPFYRYLPVKGRVLEYGCGIAPFTTGMLRYFPEKKLHYDISDILQINVLYAMYLLSGQPNVGCEILQPDDNTVKEHGYSAIICQAVLEHIPNPLELVQSFHEALDDNGILVFDYIKGEGAGLDSKKSLEERAQALRYIQSRFNVLKGLIDPEKSVGLCVVRKKPEGQSEV